MRPTGGCAAASDRDPAILQGVSTDPSIAPTTVETGARRPNVRDELELRIESLAFGGNGVARLQLDDRRYVVFVRGAVPGDLVRAVVTKRKRDYAEARTIEVLEPGPDRIDPVADHPGAPWQVLAYDTQVAIKQTQVDDALRRLGKLDGFELEPIVTAEQQWRYRNKLEYSFGLDEAGMLVCGFHAPGSWSRILHVEDCLLASERGNEIRASGAGRRSRDGPGRLRPAHAPGLSAQPRRARGPAHRGGPGAARHLRRRLGGGRRLRRRARAARDRQPDLDAGRRRRRDDRGRARHAARRAASASRRSSAGMRFALSAEAFFQTNTEMAERLYGVVSEFAALKGWERVYDLCCGIGTIGLTLAPRASEVIGVEIVEQAVTDAHANARANEISNARFIAGDVRVVLKDLAEDSGPRPDVIVVDPPRAGLSKKVVERIAEASPEAHRLRLLQPDDARAERRAARRGRLPPRQGAPGRHVPADAAHRVRGVARARLKKHGSDGLGTNGYQQEGLTFTAWARLLAGLLIQQYLVHLHRGSGAASGRRRHLIQCSVDSPQVVFCLTEDQVGAPVVLAIDEQHDPLGRVARALERRAMPAAANRLANACGEVVPVAVAAVEPRDAYIHAAPTSPGRFGSLGL